MKKLQSLLIELHACDEAIEFSQDLSIEEAVQQCERGDWLLWLAKDLELPLKPITLAKARCAKLVVHLMEDERSVKAVEVAEKFALGEATREELDTAAADAYAAYDADDADAADDAAYTPSYAAAAANADAYAAASDDAAYAAAKNKNRKEAADICIDILGKMIIENFENQNQLWKQK